MEIISTILSKYGILGVLLVVGLFILIKARFKIELEYPEKNRTKKK